jgi:hypothetical protein
MAINEHNISKAKLERREFYWEYSESKGYVLRGRLPWRKKGKKVGFTRNWRKAQEICKLWLKSSWPQLATLISQHEEPVPPPKKPKPKADKNTLDLFTTTENEGVNN